MRLAEQNSSKVEKEQSKFVDSIRSREFKSEPTVVGRLDQAKSSNLDYTLPRVVPSRRAFCRAYNMELIT